MLLGEFNMTRLVYSLSILSFNIHKKIPNVFLFVHFFLMSLQIGIFIVKHLILQKYFTKKCKQSDNNT